MKKYDFIFSIGRACACSQSLRLAGLQLLSLPWDWLALNPVSDGPDLPIRLGIMESGFADWLREEDLEFVSDLADNGKDQYRNRRYHITYLHDFPHGVPLHESFPAVKEKYDRRVARFQRLMSESKSSVLAVYMDSPVAPTADVAVCREAHKRLQALYPHVKVDFLLVSLEEGRGFENRTVEDLGGGFTRIAFDFKDYEPNKPPYSVDLWHCAAAMKSVASVKDYRTAAERHAALERTRQAKMREYGAQTRWQYFLIRRRMDFDRLREMIYPRVPLARLRRKKYDHVLSLGMNCEPAFRFSLDWGFVDSTPYAWGLSRNLRGLAESIENPGLVGSEGFEWAPDYLMWRCRRTGSYFHGKLVSGKPKDAYDPELLEADRKELVERLAYLNGKLTRILRDESSKALILRVHTKEALAPDVNECVDAVQRALESRGARNYTLVIVTERAVRGKISPAPHRVVRTVRAFNPGSSVVKEKLGDPAGWQALFAEFTPAKILPKKHLFKFEKE